MEDAKFIVSTEYDGKPRKMFPKTCEQCSETFYVPKHRLEQTKSCSSKCRSLLSRERITVPCAHCGSDVTRSKSKFEYSRSGKFFCNRTCKEAAQRLDGNCPEIRPAHYGAGNGQYSYRQDTLSSDSKCKCGIAKKYLLTVHHRDGDRTNNDVSNLEVVCYNCHALRHLKRDKNGEWYVSFVSLTPIEELEKLTVVGM